MFIDDGGPRWKPNALACCDLLHKQGRNEHQIMSNRGLYNFYFCNGVEYLINPDTDELHRVSRDYFGGPHNLATAHLENFRPCNSVGGPKVHLLSNGEEVFLFSFCTRQLIRTYRINKCRHCFPPVG